MTTIKVSATKFLASSLYAAKDDCRTYLNGVFIEKHKDSGVILWGSNGHVLCAIRDENATFDCDDTGIIIANDAALLKACKHKDAIDLIIEDRGASVGTHNNAMVWRSPGDITSVTVGGRYANPRRVFNADLGDDQYEMPVLAAQYTALIGATSKILHGKKEYVATRFYPHDRQLRFCFEGNSDFFGVISSMRVEKYGPTFGWIQ